MYEFRTTTGAICCSGTDVRNLCASCKARAKTVEAPPSLVAAVRNTRTTDASQRLAAHFNKPRPVSATAAHAAFTGGVTAAPSLIAAIKENRS